MRSDLEMLLGLADQLDVVVPHRRRTSPPLSLRQVAKDAPDFSFGDTRFGERGIGAACAARGATFSPAAARGSTTRRLAAMRA